MSGRAEPVRTSVEVRSYELDSFGHANHAVIVNYLEHGRFRLLRAGGLAPETITARGWGVHVVRIEVDYRAEAMMGDRLIIESWVEAARHSSMTLGQRVVREGDPGTVVAEASIVAVWVGADRRPIRIPDEVRAAIEPFLTPEVS